MFRHHIDIKWVAWEIASAADKAMEAYQKGRVYEEPQITDRIIGAIEDRINSVVKEEARDQFLDSIVWEARTLRTGTGIAAEEKRHGADLMGILDIDIVDYRVVKGFLVQAKKAEPHKRFTTHEWDSLQSQCVRMLQRTSDSFIWVYSKVSGIRIFPAISVLGLRSRNIFDLDNLSSLKFFEDHLSCFIGDSRLDSTDIQTLDTLEMLPIERILRLSAIQTV